LRAFCRWPVRQRRSTMSAVNTGHLPHHPARWLLSLQERAFPSDAPAELRQSSFVMERYAIGITDAGSLCHTRGLAWLVSPFVEAVIVPRAVQGRNRPVTLSRLGRSVEEVCRIAAHGAQNWGTPVSTR